MDQLLGTIFGAGFGLLTTAVIDAADHHRQKKKRSSTFTSDGSSLQSAMESSSHLLTTHTSPAYHPRGVLVASSSKEFGQTCERLVNIAFHTSQAFPNMMSTCADISEYLRNELVKQYRTEDFQIIIGQNHAFSFAVDDAAYLAEIEQDQYRVLIFTTKRDAHCKADTHDANSTMLIDWNLTVRGTSNK